MGLLLVNRYLALRSHITPRDGHNALVRAPQVVSRQAGGLENYLET
jgi:hypothetical protein